MARGSESNSKKQNTSTDSGKSGTESTETSQSSGLETPIQEKKENKPKIPTKYKFAEAVNAIERHCSELFLQGDRTEDLKLMQRFLSSQTPLMDAAFVAVNNKLFFMGELSYSPKKTSRRTKWTVNIEYSTTRQLIDQCMDFFLKFNKRARELVGMAMMDRRDILKMKKLYLSYETYTPTLQAADKIIKERLLKMNQQ